MSNGLYDKKKNNKFDFSQERSKYSVPGTQARESSLSFVVFTDYR